MPSAIQAAGEALGLTTANIQMLQGVAPKKAEKALTTVLWPMVTQLRLMRYLLFFVIGVSVSY